jgi:phosphatidylserine/phosphatidylglycerophosphate/cardiolipin synthase-like enzyme
MGLILILALYLLFQWLERRPSRPAIPVSTSQTFSFQVYFTNPQDPRSSSLRGGPDEHLAQAIDGAKYSVDMAIYRLDLWSLRDALIDAHRRGVAVRMVVESAHQAAPEIEQLIARRIPIVFDDRDPLMHHKFTVIDGFEVWTGSMNYTLNGAYRNDNNMIRIYSHEVAENFTQEFEEMFEEERFGRLSRADTPHPISRLGGQQVGVYFSPDDGVEAQLVRIITEAMKSIQVMAFSLTSDALGEALIEAAQRGIEVSVVIERDQAANAGSEVGRLIDSGVDLRLDTNPDSMHHKVFLVDDTIVVTGSYNFSRNAEEANDENIIILYDETAAAEYLVEFKRIFELATTDWEG